jgi:hypothetical protein
MLLFFVNAPNFYKGKYKATSYILCSFTFASRRFCYCVEYPLRKSIPVASPMHVSSPQHLPAIDQIQGPVSSIAVEHDYLASTCPIESSDCMGDKNLSDIPDALLLEVQISLPSTVVVPGPLSMTTHSEKPVSLSAQDHHFRFFGRCCC